MKTLLNKTNKNASKVVFYKEQGGNCCNGGNGSGDISVPIGGGK